MILVRRCQDNNKGENVSINSRHLPTFFQNKNFCKDTCVHTMCQEWSMVSCLDRAGVEIFAHVRKDHHPRAQKKEKKKIINFREERGHKK